jgi:ligand-binding SRPBCC domain-containing protein
VGQDEQGLPSGGEPAPAAADALAVRGQLAGQVAQARTGQSNRGWVDKHLKLLEPRAILVVNPSIRSFASSHRQAPKSLASGQSGGASVPHFEITTALTASPERVFDACLNVEEHTRSMGASAEQAVGGRTRGALRLGETVTFQARHFGLSWRLTARITSYDRPWRFVDEQEVGPFKRWRHEHHFVSDGSGGTIMRDVVDFASPLGALGRLADATVLGWYMPRLITSRNSYLARTL